MFMNFHWYSWRQLIYIKIINLIKILLHMQPISEELYKKLVKASKK